MQASFSLHHFRPCKAFGTSDRRPALATEAIMAISTTVSMTFLNIRQVLLDALRLRRRKSRGHRLDHGCDGEVVGDISPAGQPAAGVLRNLRVVAIDVAMAAISTLPTART